MKCKQSGFLKKLRCFFFSKKERGIALFLVLWVLTLLSVIVGEFCRTMRTEVNITRNFKEETQAYYIALAGLNTAIAELVKNEVTPPQVKASEASETSDTEEEKIEWRTNTNIPRIPFAQGYFKVTIGNESGKININKADQRLLKMMLNRFDLEENDKEGIADSILDWRDKDNLHRLNGAEDDYYQSLPEPYECKDGDFDSIEELLLVKGMTPEIFYGGLKDIVTVWQDEDSATTRKTRRKRKGSKKKGFDFSKININAASPEMLRLLPRITDDQILKIMEFREENNFKSLDELFPILGIEAYKAILPFITLKESVLFTIRSTGMIEDSHTRKGVEIMVKIDSKLKKKYRIVRWIE